MSATDEIMANIPLRDLAAQLGVDEATAEAATRQAIPALLGGMQANAADPAGAASLAGALGDHPSELVDGGVNLDQVDADDGQKIVGNIFGDNTGQVAQTLGANVGQQSGLIQKLLPILAPIVLAYLSKRLTGSSQGGGSGNVLTDLLGSMLGRRSEPGRRRQWTRAVRSRVDSRHAGRPARWRPPLASRQSSKPSLGGHTRGQAALLRVAGQLRRPVREPTVADLQLSVGRTRHDPEAQSRVVPAARHGFRCGPELGKVGYEVVGDPPGEHPVAERRVVDPAAPRPSVSSSRVRQAVRCRRRKSSSVTADPRSRPLETRANRAKWAEYPVGKRWARRTRE